MTDTRARELVRQHRDRCDATECGLCVMIGEHLRLRALEAEGGELERLRGEVQDLREAGRALATCAFNLKQRNHLTDRERRSLAESQECWDAAVRTRGEGSGE